VLHSVVAIISNASRYSFMKISPRSSGYSPDGSAGFAGG
jgi:hypothetical protein